MKRIVLLLAALALTLPGFSQQQKKVDDKDLATTLWIMQDLYPEGFTIDIDKMEFPKEGLMVSYEATQDHFDRSQLPAVIKHARAHEGIVGGWRDPDTGLYYFDSTRDFPEDSLAAALAFARENGQHSVFDVKRGINVKSNYEQQDIRIIYDCDMGSSTDDLFALMMLYRYMDMKRCTLLGVIVDRMDRANADAVDVLNNYYGYPDIPIGLEQDGVKDPRIFIPYHNMAYARSVEGKPLFKRSVGDDGEYLDGYKLYRKLLARQPDKSVTIASVGFVTCLSRLLQSGPDEYSPLTGVQLVQKKVKNIYMMGGVFGDSFEHDYNFTAAIDYSLKFFELLPKDIDIVFSPGEVGDPLYYSAADIISDMDWTDSHPIKWIYEFLVEDKFQKMWDPLAVINAVEGDDIFYELSPRGWVTLTPTGETDFEEDPQGNARYQIPGDEGWSDFVLKYIRLLSIQH
ncbi:MAG: nucleoside hydrolase [Bacteroidales bacterium]|nr:nucleoside hydrolase [Bacteroidales bacterium]